jgi:hypothetical protein
MIRRGGLAYRGEVLRYDEVLGKGGTVGRNEIALKA